MLKWQQVSRNILSLFLHPNCSLCGRSAEKILCENCASQLEQCRLSQPRFQGKGGVSVFAWGEYGGMVKRAIAQLKYEQAPELARPLGVYLGETWLALAPSSLKPIVVPIPLHPEKQKQRGYNQAELIARSFSQTTGLPLQGQGLKRIRNTKALFGLSPQQRQQVVAEAFALGKGLNRKHPVILIDDIYTTGTTVETAQITLEKQGIKVMAVGAIAASRVAFRGTTQP